MSQIRKLVQGKTDNLELPPLKVSSNISDLDKDIKTGEISFENTESNSKNEYSDLLNSDFSNPAFSNPEVVRKPLDKEQKKKALMSELASNIGIVATPEQMGLLFELYPGTKKLIKFGLLSQIAKQSAPGILSKFGVVNEIISDKELEIELEPEKEIFLTKKKRRFSKKYYR